MFWSDPVFDMRSDPVFQNLVGFRYGSLLSIKVFGSRSGFFSRRSDSVPVFFEGQIRIRFFSQRSDPGFFSRVSTDLGFFYLKV